MTKLNDDTKVYTHLEGGADNDSNITEGKKKFMFSATGNIMVATTEEDSTNMDKDVRSVFNEVSVFFAAMSKAISTTQRPNSTENYSIYDYAALEKVIDGSGCFTHCTQEDIEYKSSSFGADFSRELITALLGLPVGGGALSFAQAMISSLGQEGLKLSRESESSDSRVGNIVFVCEYLFGMPIVSATVVYIDSKSETSTLNAGPCVKVNKTEITMKMHKDVYMFVTPTFIKKYAKDLSSVITSKAYGEFVSYLQALITPGVIIDGIYDNDTKVTGSELKAGVAYTLQGANFGADKGNLMFGEQLLEIKDWEENKIEFKAPETEIVTSEYLIIKTSKGESNAIGPYIVVK